MPHQVPVTIIASVPPGEQAALTALLTTMGADPAGNNVIPFGQFPNLHFARLLVLDASRDLQGKPIGPLLIFLSDIDSPLDDYLANLVDAASDGIDQIWTHCEGYPANTTRTRASRLQYLRSRMVAEDTAYINTIGRSVRQVHQEAALRDAIESFLDRSSAGLAGKSPEEIRAAIQGFVDGEASLQWAHEPAEPPALLWRLKEALHMVGVPLGLLVLSPALLLALPFWLVLLRLHEKADPAPRFSPDSARVQELGDLEDHIVQNQFSAVGYFKPGLFRRITAAAVLYFVYYGTRHLFNDGNLTGVKTIHFARWVSLNERRRLIFASNYDGSLESYMDDFIDKVAWGLNAVFSNGVGYTKTNWLLMDGAKDELAFKGFLRQHQVPTQVWYSAYPRLTAVNLQNNAKLRAGLYGDMTTSDVEAWLRRL
jgi:hypothetical protein